MSTCVTHEMTNHHAPGLFDRLGDQVHVWLDRYQGRHELARWSERDLHDLGLSRGDVSAEIDKPFWRA